MAQYTKVPDHSHSDNELMPLALDPADALAPVAMRSQINPPRDEIYNSKLEKVYLFWICLLYTSPSPRDGLLSRMPSSA